MSEAEVRAFLMGDPPHTGKLATTRKDGRPHVAPIWFVLDDDGTIIFHTGKDTLKGRTLLRDPRAAFCVDDERPPFSFVIVNGVVETSDNPPDSLHWATLIGGRYMGADQAEAYGKRNAVPGEMLCRLRPTTIVSEKNLAL